MLVYGSEDSERVRGLGIVQWLMFSSCVAGWLGSGPSGGSGSSVCLDFGCKKLLESRNVSEKSK